MSPSGVATDLVGNVYIASGSLLPVVFKVDNHGILTIFAGNGVSGYSGDGGPATQAELVDPFGVAVDGSGNIFIADYVNNRIREVVAKTGMIQTVAGNGKQGYSGDGSKATQAELSGPSAVAVDGSGDIFITDSENNVIREVTAATGIIQTVAGNGKGGHSGDGGKATQAELNGPSAACVDDSGNIFIADSVNERVREVVAATGIIQTVAGNGTFGYSGDGGPATQAELADPLGVAVDNTGNLLIADWANNVVREVVATTGTIQTLATNGTQLGGPERISVDSGGNIFIAESDNRVQEVVAATGIIQTLAGDGTTGGSGNGGLATDANLAHPQGVFVDGSGNIFIADNNQIRKVVAASGIIQPVAGNGTYGYSGDGGPATQAELAGPQGVAVDKSGNIFISDSGNAVVREVVAATGIIQTVAGNGTSGYSGDGGKATQAQLGSPDGLFVDSSGNIFIADPFFYTCYIDPDGFPICLPGGGGTIREVDAKTGNIQTVAGNGTEGYSSDGGLATQTELDGPTAVFVDTSGNIFLADAGSNRIREVKAATGIIETVAGKGNPGHSGDGGLATQAELNQPTSVFVDASGDIFLADSGNNRIREVLAATGIIQTVAGNGTAGFSGDGGLATQAELAFPDSLVLDSTGDIVFVDSLNSRVRKLTPSKS
jgi:sugar lactone lactonase YvrE